MKSVTKAFSVLETLANTGELELGDLSKAVELPKSSVHRILSALEALGYVQQNEQTHAYSASVKLFELGGLIVRRVNVADIAVPIIGELANDVGETVNLGILDGLDIICIHKVDSIHPLRMDQPVGSRAKAYCTAMGKAVLAFLPELEVRRLLADHSIVPGTPNSLTEIHDIIVDLRAARERGYAIDREEAVLGVCCVGAPIIGPQGRPVAGMSIAGPAVRMTDDVLCRLGRLVKDSAKRVTEFTGGKAVPAVK